MSFSSVCSLIFARVVFLKCNNAPKQQNKNKNKQQKLVSSFFAVVFCLCLFGVSSQTFYKVLTQECWYFFRLAMAFAGK